MALGNLPFSFEENFERGTKGNFDTEADTGSLLDYPHYSTLAKIPRGGTPYRGAYCMRINCGDTNDHTLLEGDINVATSGNGYVRFALWISPDFAATADDIFNIFEWQSAGGVVEHSISLQITAASDLVEIGMGDGAEATVFSSPLSKGVWHSIENHLLVDSGVGNDGTSQLWIDGQSVASLASLDHAGAITDGVLGTQNTLSTTTGVLLFDQFVFDTARIGMPQDRWVEDILLTQSGHAFVGPGVIDNVTLLETGGTDNTLTLYDTDEADTVNQSNVRLHLSGTATAETVDPAGTPIYIKRGAYVVLAGTSPTGALVKLHKAVAFGSDGAVRGFGVKQ